MFEKLGYKYSECWIQNAFGFDSENGVMLHTISKICIKE